jgi:hypothetical protein
MEVGKELNHVFAGRSDNAERRDLISKISRTDNVSIINKGSKVITLFVFMGIVFSYSDKHSSFDLRFVDDNGEYVVIE